MIELTQYNQLESDSMKFGIEESLIRGYTRMLNITCYEWLKRFVVTIEDIMVMVERLDAQLLSGVLLNDLSQEFMLI